MKEKFKGLWPAMFTPIDDSGAPSLHQLEKLVELLISQHMDGLYILGSTGQGMLFSEEQRRKVAEVVVQTASKRIPVIVQVGSFTTDECVRLAKHAAKCGADGISSVGPIYFPQTAPMVLEHYRKIATATDLPFFAYQFGDYSIPGDAISFVKKLLEIPNVAGMKLTTNQILEISTIYNYVGNKLSLFSGSDEVLCHASLCGTVGAIGTFYNLFGIPCKQVMTEFKAGNYQLARNFMLAFQNSIQAVIPNIWPFFRKAMMLKYDINIGYPKAPLGNTQKEWKEEDIIAMIERVESMAGSMINDK